MELMDHKISDLLMMQQVLWLVLGGVERHFFAILELDFYDEP